MSRLLKTSDPYLQWLGLSELQLRIQRRITCEMSELPYDLKVTDARIHYANSVTEGRVFLSAWSLWLYFTEQNYTTCCRVSLPGFYASSNTSTEIALAPKGSGSVLVLQINDTAVVEQWMEKLRSLERKWSNQWERFLRGRDRSVIETTLKETSNSRQCVVSVSGFPGLTGDELRNTLAENAVSLDSLAASKNAQIREYVQRLQVALGKTQQRSVDMRTLISKLQRAEEVLIEGE